MNSLSEHSLIAANAPRWPRRRLLGAAAMVPLVSWANPHAKHGQASPFAANSVADFDETTWARLQQTGPRPAAYVFTTTYCSTCPDAFDKLQAFIKASRQKVELAAVVMDVPAERVLAHAHHYAGATKFFAFDGFAPAIRQSVDPKWPNVTPYIVLLSRAGAVQRCIGPPEPAMLKKWLA
ncbi:MAG: hypothetical protein IPO19_04785 [Rhodoferax sp.]|nr:hypothetical protein [Rhodoferax sp.]